MDTTRYAAIEARLADIEERLCKLENMGNEEWISFATEARLMKKFPAGMDKSHAAEELGVTRATVYAMLADGRLSSTGMGRVDTYSVARLLKTQPAVSKRYVRDE